jgi:hypothetical protein
MSVQRHFTIMHGGHRPSGSIGLRCRVDVGESTGLGRIGVGERFRPDIKG